MRAEANSSSWVSAVIVALGIACAEFSTNVTAFLLPTLRDYFGTSNQLVSLSVACGLVGVGVSGLFYGIASDLLGRRKIYLTSLFIYLFGTLGMMVSKQFEWFLLARFIQGLGSGSAWVVGTALLRDQESCQIYRKQISFLHVTSGFVRGACPILGAVFLVWFGWQSNYAFLLCLALITLAFFYKQQAETINPKELSRKNIIQGAIDLRASSTFKKFLTIKVLCVIAIFIMLAKLPLILDQIEMESFYSGQLQGLMFGCFIVGTLLGEWGASRLSITQVIVAALALGIVASGLMLVNITLIFSLMAYGLCFVVWGMIFANATSQIVGAVASASGLACSVMMFFEMNLGGVGVYLSNQVSTPTFESCALPVLLLLGSALACGCYNYRH